MISDVIKNNVKPILKKYPVQASLTAGYDTRTILSCIKKYKKDIKFITNETDSNIDVKVSKYISKKHKLNHQVHEHEGASQSEKMNWIVQTGAAAGGGGL